MENLTRTSIGQAFWIILAIVIAVTIVLIVVFVFLPKKKLCAHCGKEKTRNKDGICETCTNERLLQKAQMGDTWNCPIHGTGMNVSLIVDINNVVVHQCTAPGCTVMALDRNDLQKITLLELDFYPN